MFAQCSFSLYQNCPNFMWKSRNNHHTMVTYFSFLLFWYLILYFSEIEKFQGSDGKKEDEEKKYLDVISNKNIKLSERVLIPVKQYPKVLHVASTLFSVCLLKSDNCVVLHSLLWDKHVTICYMNICKYIVTMQEEKLKVQW